MEVNENLKHTLSILPRKPGVYLFKDIKNQEPKKLHANKKNLEQEKQLCLNKLQ
jgi:hypothetical protein